MAPLGRPEGHRPVAGALITLQDCASEQSPPARRSCHERSPGHRLVAGRSVLRECFVQACLVSCCVIVDLRSNHAGPAGPWSLRVASRIYNANAGSASWGNSAFDKFPRLGAHRL